MSPPGSGGWPVPVPACCVDVCVKGTLLQGTMAQSLVCPWLGWLHFPLHESHIRGSPATELPALWAGVGELPGPHGVTCGLRPPLRVTRMGEGGVSWHRSSQHLSWH